MQGRTRKRVLAGEMRIESISILDFFKYGCTSCGAAAEVYPYGIVVCGICGVPNIIVNVKDEMIANHPSGVELRFIIVGQEMVPHRLASFLKARRLVFWDFFHPSYHTPWGFLFNRRELINDRLYGATAVPKYVRVFEPVELGFIQSSDKPVQPVQRPWDGFQKWERHQKPWHAIRRN